MAKSFKIPKKIAGVKIPKRIRKSGRSLAGLLESPTGRDMAAAALTAMAGVLVGRNRQVRDATGDAGRTASQAAAGAGALVRDMAEAAVGAVSEAARDLVPPAGSGKGQAQPAKRSSDPASKTH